MLRAGLAAPANGRTSATASSSLTHYANDDLETITHGNGVTKGSRLRKVRVLRVVGVAVELRSLDGLQGELDALLTGLLGTPEDTVKRIDDSIVEQIERELDLGHRYDWLRVYLERQEDGTFLLISIELQSDASPESIKETCSLIKEVVVPRIRAVGDHVAWIGSVEVNGKVVGTMIPGILDETE